MVMLVKIFDGRVQMLQATRMALIQTLQALLAEEQAMLKKLRDRSIELEIERFAAELEAMEEEESSCDRRRSIAIRNCLYPSSRGRPRRGGWRYMGSSDGSVLIASRQRGHRRFCRRSQLQKGSSQRKQVLGPA